MLATMAIREQTQTKYAWIPKLSMLSTQWLTNLAMLLTRLTRLLRLISLADQARLGVGRREQLPTFYLPKAIIHCKGY